MTRKKSNSKKSFKPKISLQLKEETRHWVLSILFFVLAIFFILAAFDKAGMVGGVIFKWFELLFGIGYFMLPLLLLLLTLSFLKNKRPDFVSTTIFGAIIFFFSGLGVISILAGDNLGGLLGRLISSPLLSLFSFWISLIFLFAIFIISLSVIFDAKPTMESLAWFKRFKKEEEEKQEEDAKEELLEEEEEEETIEEEQEEEPKKKKEGGKMDKIKKALSIKDSNSMDDVSADYMGSSTYSPPPLSLLASDKGKPGVGDIKANANIIKRTLQNFGVNVEMDEISIGPSITRYALKPAEGVKLSRIVGLQNDLSLALAAHPIRIEAPIPGKSLVGIEIPNSTKTTVGFGSLLSSDEYQKSPKPLLLSLGKDISGKAIFANLAKMPHLLIAGATGAGKSVTIHTIINSLLFKNPPENLRFIMIDPKRVELTLYNKIPHLLAPVITDAKKTIQSLQWAVREMDRRYDILETESVQNISSYHKNIVEPALENNKDGKNTGEEASMPERMPYIVVIIDELATIMSSYPRELESSIVRLAQMSRAVGIHLILSTQRPSVNVITGLIKANVPSRIALQVASQIDSRTILDAGGAEKLLGAGDMLYMSGEMGKPVRLQSAFISEAEVKKIVKYLTNEYIDAVPNEIIFTDNEDKNSIFESSLEDDSEDELYEEARKIAMEEKASTSYLQRRLRIGYQRAARLMDMLEDKGVVGPANGSKAREVYETDGSDEEKEEEAGEEGLNEEDEEKTESKQRE